ncbi:hypothetical protein RAS1_32350 [Phycisphaerae bacterium RAS1]|nr:hypothetical protein RAS1_32350 [Phycisphaerae bacterium RAS1]
MSSRSQCPARDTVFAAASGTLTSEQSAAIQAHVATCRRCIVIWAESRRLEHIAETLADARLNKRDYERIDRWRAETLARLDRTRRRADE